MENYWKPKGWIAILLGFFLQPFAFLYVNKLKFFWWYLFFIVIASTIDWHISTYFSWCFILLCPIHAFLLSKKQIAAHERRWFSHWWGIPSILVSIFIPIFLIRSFLFEPFSIPAGSMSPTINVGDLIIVKKLGFGSYGTYGISLWNPGVSNDDQMKRGSIYAFYKPESNIPYVKRLIAKSGDTVEIKSGVVIVNNNPLDLKRINNTKQLDYYEERIDKISYAIFNGATKESIDFKKITVPPDNYFFLGDNRGNSFDSRFWGTVDKHRIIGEIIYIYNNK